MDIEIIEYDLNKVIEEIDSILKKCKKGNLTYTDYKELTIRAKFISDKTRKIYDDIDKTKKLMGLSSGNIK